MPQSFRRSLARLIVAGVICAGAAALQAEPVPPDSIFDAEEGQALFADVLRSAGYGLNDFERAAFIIRDGDGSVRCELWPSTHRKDEESFRGSIPAGTLAIVHTHPFGYPLPSAHDVAEASRLNVPIYVLTLREVSRVLPGNKWPDILSHTRFWYKPAMRDEIRCQGS